ncbi:MAG: hypothetical protein H6577_01455 [Lewinellaceae bacterium]|nr:hypothetical protein [Lewinellaceae bacterium]
MYRSNIYPKLILLVSFMVLGFSSVFAQLEMKLQLLDEDTWGVYVKSTSADTLSSTAYSASGQVTIVMPAGFVWTGPFSGDGGLWTAANGTIVSPPENPTKQYVSFGLQSNTPPIQFPFGSETLLFTINRVSPCPDSIYLIDCNSATGVSDPFCPDFPDGTPGTNTPGTNPGNDLSVVDIKPGVGTFFYNYSDNYALSAWSCHDCDGDGILNGIEDTNGNGVFDPGLDSSALCDPCDPFHPEAAEMELIGGADVICANDLGDTAYFHVNITGGWSPYDVYYTFNGGIDTVSVLDYVSGDSIAFVPDSSVTLNILYIIDSFGCLLDTAFTDGIVISVHGPISVTDQPDNVVECSNYGTYFTIDTQNDGDGVIQYNWQTTMDTTGTYSDMDNVSPYARVFTDSMTITSVAGLHGRYYRCKIFTSVCDTVYSAWARLDVEGPITVTTHPSNFVNCATEDASFTAAANNAGAVGTMAYQWQVNSGSGWTDLPAGVGPGGATYANVTTTTVNITNLFIGMDGWLYRMKISTGQCDTIYTNAAALDVDGTLAVVDDPDDISNCAGNEVYFIAEWSNPGAAFGNQNSQYEWQINTGSGWTAINNAAGIYTNVIGNNVGGGGNDTLTISNVLGLDGAQYRLCLRSATCSVPVYSAPASLAVSGNVGFTNQPDDITVCSANDTIFVACASIPQGTFYFYWESSADLGVTWDSIDMTGVFSHGSGGSLISSGCDTLFISDVAGMGGRWFRAVAKATDCGDIASDEARLSVQGPLTPVDPVDVTSCGGEDAVLISASFTNPDGLNSTIYRWQFRPNSGAAWADLTNGTSPYNGTSTDQLSIGNTAGLNGYQYRLSARTTTCNIQYTNFMTLTVEGPIVVDTHPTPVTVCAGGSASFTSTGSLASGVGTLAYQWQRNSGSGWVNIDGTTDGGVYSNYDATTLNISDVTGLYSYCYRLAYTTAFCSVVYSNQACLTVEGPINIDVDPVDVTQCSGEQVNFFISASNSSPDGGTLQYQWQVSTNNGSSWDPLTNDTIYNGTKTDSLSISISTGLDSNLYRAIIWTGTCANDTSLAAMLLIEGPLTVIDEPDNITECSGNGVLMQATIVNAGLGAISYQWERSCDGGTTWGDVASGGPNNYSGETTATLNIGDIVGLDSCRYRLRYWTPNCNPGRTNYAVVTEEGAIRFTSQPVSRTICSGNPVCFAVETENDNSGLITYQWQVRHPITGLWSNLNNNSTFSGVKTANMCISNVATYNNFCFRALIQTVHCASIASDSACLTVQGPITFSKHPTDIIQCSGEDVLFTGSAGITAGNAGTIIYQWQYSSDCINFSDVADGGFNGYVGATNDSLVINNVAGLDNYCFRLTARTDSCNRVNSFSAKLRVDGPLTVVSSPVNRVNCDNKQALFVADIANAGYGGEVTIQYQWQQSFDGVTYTNLVDGDVGSNTYGGTKGDTLLIAPISGLDSTFYRLKAWTGTCDTVITNRSLLRVDGPITFTDQPDDYITCASTETVCFTTAIQNATGVSSASYRWEYSTVSGIWTNVPNAAPYALGSVTTNQLCITNTANLYNYRYRCKVYTPYCDTLYSDLAQLFVEGPISIDLEPVDAAICNNTNHAFISEVSLPAASSGGMTFQWQVKPPSGPWANIPNTVGGAPTGFGGLYTGVKTEELQISLVDQLDGYMYRLVITTSRCADTTQEVTLTVLDACTTGTCDFDLDGLINDIDPDDDDDQLYDFWEDWMTLNNLQIATDTFVGSGPWFYQVSPSDTTKISYSNCNQDTDGDGILDNQEDPDGDNINNGEETDGYLDNVFNGNPLDPCDPILGPTCIGVNLAIRVNLQGAKISTSGTDTLMRDNLRNLQVSNGANTYKRGIPRREPYTTLPMGSGTSPAFHHVGDGLVQQDTLSQSDSTLVFATTGPNAIVDWVFVEIRSSTSLDSVASTRSAFLQRDGDVVDVDGVSTLRFLTLPAGPYYVSVRHRNHLGIMTAESFDLSPVVTEVDFTDNTFPTYGDYGQIELNGRMYLWGGDLNADGRTIYQGPGNDIFKLFTTVLNDTDNTGLIANYISQGYQSADIDLNGKAIYQGPGNDRALLLFNTILSHPANVNNIANYVILETLP